MDSSWSNEKRKEILFFIIYLSKKMQIHYLRLIPIYQKLINIIQMKMYME